MPIQKVPVTTLDDPNHRRRRAEVLNQVLDHSFDDSRRQTAAEKLAGVTPVNPAWPPLCVNRYGTNTIPGTTSMTAAWQAAIDVAKLVGGKITWDVNQAPYLIDDELDCTNAVGGTNKSYWFSGDGGCIAATVNAPNRPDIVFSHTGTCFDCTGTLGVFFENMTITTPTSNYPEICFLMARNSDVRSMYCRWNNVMIHGHFSIACLYNYGMEEEDYFGPQWFNRANDANAKVMIFTARNIRSVTSNFTTISTGEQSTVNHCIFGGSISMFSSHATADCIEIEGGARFGRIYGTWMDCKDGSAKGRSLIYFNSTNSESDGWVFSDIEGEAAAIAPDYGIRFGGEAARTYSKIVVRDCSFPNSTNTISSHADITLNACRFDGVGNQSIGGGVNIAGTLTSSYHSDIDGAITVGGGYIRNNNVLVQGEASRSITDNSAASNRKEWRLRSVSGQFALAQYADDGTTNNGNAIVAVSDGSAITDVNITATTTKVSGELKFDQALVALGGGAAPTLGTIGGSGPATAGQNSWKRLVDTSGTPFWVPVWK